jgi:MtaA/CmuA family methyltransferase
MNGRERAVAAATGKPTDRLACMPITMQFACDFIGAQYLEYATDYRVLVEGQIRTAEAFGLDYVNTMSDPACEAADCGAGVTYFPNSPPAIDEWRALLAEKSMLVGLAIPDPTAGGRMTNRLKALDLYRTRVGDSLLIEGWIEGPIAEAADLRGLNTLMLDFYDDHQFVRDLFDFVLEMELTFAKNQIAAGAQCIGIGDAAASLIGPALYEEFVYPYEKRMVDAIHAMGALVRLHICGNTKRILGGIGRLGCDIVDIDFLAPLDKARTEMGEEQTLLGNMDPVRVLRNGTPQDVRAVLEQCHIAAGERFIVGAGCEVVRDTPHDNFRALIACADGTH